MRALGWMLFVLLAVAGAGYWFYADFQQRELAQRLVETQEKVEAATRIVTAYQQFQQLKDGIAAHLANHGTPPASLNEVAPWLADKTVTADPWGNPYQYRLLGVDGYELICHGPDGPRGNAVMLKDTKAGKPASAAPVVAEAVPERSAAELQADLQTIRDQRSDLAVKLSVLTDHLPRVEAYHQDMIDARRQIESQRR